MGSSGNSLQAQNDTIRVPLYSEETDRSYTNDYQGQVLVNCFAHVVRNPITGDGEVQISKRHGAVPTTLNISTHITSQSTDYDAYLAVYPVTNLYDVYIVAVKDGASTIRIIQVRPESGTSTLIGSITTSGAGTHKVYFSHGWTGQQPSINWTLTVNYVDSDGVTNKAYTAQASGGVFTASSLAQITAATSPWGSSVNTRGPILQLNNQWYVAALDGRIYNTGTALPDSSYVSQADTSTSPAQGWNSVLNWISSRFPEQFEGMILYKHHLVAFGKTSIQFFNDEGQSIGGGGSPLLPTDQALIRFGVLSCNHMLNVDDVLYWIAYGKNGSAGVWRLDGYTPVKISNKNSDDKLISLFNGGLANYCYLYTFLLNSKRHVGIGGVDNYSMGYTPVQTDWPSSLTNAYNVDYCVGMSLIYNIDDKTWWNISLGNNNLIGIHPFTLFNRTNTSSYLQYFMRADSTKVWKFSPEGFSDKDLSGNDVLIPAVIQLNTLDFSTETRKRLNRVKVIYQGVPSVTSAGTQYLVLLYNKTSNVSAASYKNRYIDLYQPVFRYNFNNLGMFRSINLSLINISDQPFELRALEVNLSQGVH